MPLAVIEVKTALFVALAALAAFVAGCASTDSAASRRPAGPPANVAGSWSGFTVGAGGTSVALKLRQSGNAVTGTIEVGGGSGLTLRRI